MYIFLDQPNFKVCSGLTLQENINMCDSNGEAGRDNCTPKFGLEIAKHMTREVGLDV